MTNLTTEPRARFRPLLRRIAASEAPPILERVPRRAPPGLITRYFNQVRATSLALGDAVSLLLACLAVDGGSIRLVPLVLALVWVPIGSAVYTSSRRLAVGLAHTFLDDVPVIGRGALLAVAITELLDGHHLSAASSGLFLATLFGLLCLTHQVALGFWQRRRTDERVLMVGEGAAVHRFRRKLALEPTLRGELVAAIEPVQHGMPLTPDALLAAALQLLDELDCDRMVINADDLDGDQLRSLTRAGIDSGLKLSVIPSSTGALGSRARLSHLADLPMIEFDGRPISSLQQRIKRLVDIVLSASLLLVASPLLACTALAVWLDDRGPILFRQVRGGLAGVPFTMFKFRTMHVNAEELLGDLLAIDDLDDPMYKLKHDPRVTRVGRFLRSTSLDELPQLLNVLRGEMSIVGPRPEEYRLVQRYDEQALAIRCGMKPGITGPMQVHGRGELTFRERLDCEREYLENYSLARDVRILAMTVLQLFGRGVGAY